MRPIITIPNLHAPKIAGAKSCPIDFDFRTIGPGSIAGDLVQELANELDFVQSLWVDNSLNPEQFNFNVAGIGDNGQTISVQPFSQGYFEITPAYGDGFRFAASTNAALLISTQLYNIPMPYHWWPCNPPLVAAPLNFQPLSAIADNTIIAAGSAVQGARVYAMVFDVSAATTVQFFDGPSASAKPLTGLITLGINGSLFLNGSTPQLQTSPGNALTMSSTSAVNLGGLIKSVTA